MLSPSGQNQRREPDFKDPVKKIRYGSVKSTYGGSDIYIIYYSGRAYPEYLIEYSNQDYMGKENNLLGLLRNRRGYGMF